MTREFVRLCVGRLRQRGFLDLYVANGGGGNQAQDNFLYHNNGNSNAWINSRV